MATNTREAVEAMGFPPASPGDLLADLIECNNLKQAEVARRLGVGRQTVIHLLQGRRELSLVMARRLGRLFGNGPAIWLQLQQARQMWRLLNEEDNDLLKVEPLNEVELAA